MILLLMACVRLAARCDAPADGFLDADGDGVGDAVIAGCAGDAWIVPDDGDCDDGDAAVYPGADDAWYDGVDADCAGDDDFDQDGDGFAAIDGGGEDCDDTREEVNPDHEEVWYNGADDACDGGDDYDQDGDGARAEEHGGDDCDDTDPASGPDAPEVWYDGIDQDCAGGNDYDQDGDGWAPDDYADEAGLAGGDCDDVHADANPEGVEDCDGVDDDCDGVVDDGFDEDGDGYAGCVEDCDDTDPDVNPAATEVCDGVDQDCDGTADDGFDTDGDGWAACVECDDADPDVHPGAAETWYDGVDQDCDGGSDQDQDGDGADLGDEDCDDEDAAIHAGAPEVPYDGVDQDCDGDDLTDVDGDGWDAEIVGGDDCDDGEEAVHPGAAERWYDGVDQDCDGASDDDQDGDGFDDDGHGGDDCDDTDPAVNPDAAETWYDGVDQDCDGASDDDQDGDGFDDDGHGGDDCDDLDAAVNPDAADALDGDDDDCDGEIDDPDPEDVAVAVVRGEDAGQAIGADGVALVADLDADGEDELVLASAADAGGGADAGAVWLFGWTELGDVPVSDAWLTLEGATGDQVGASFASLDWNGDGDPDLAVGAPGADAVYVLEPGSASSSRHAASALDYATVSSTSTISLGSAVCAADLDGDGVDDLVVGSTAASSTKGEVWVFLGSTSAASVTTSGADYAIPGSDSGDAIGGTLACGGDVTGDGLADFAVGVPGDDENSRTNSGSVFLVAGSSLYLNLGLALESVDTWTLTGSASSQAVGASVVIEDVSGSTNADVVVGASGYSWSGGTGAVGVFEGATSGSESFSAADRLVRGSGSAGEAVGTPDLDGDGAPDLLVGASGADSAWLVGLSGTGTLDLPGDQLGRWLATGGSLGAAVSRAALDLDGDGVDDVAVAAPDDAGVVYVLTGFP